jgi:hypothetical protein
MVHAIISLVLIVVAAVVIYNPFSPNLITPSISSQPTVLVSPSPVVSPSPKQTTELKQKVLLDVPFVAQAPTGKWSDSRQQDGCEEAASYMAYLWVKGEKASADLSVQEQKLIEISDWEEERYGSYHDTSAKDTLARILKGYFEVTTAEVKTDINASDIKRELSLGNLVLVPADGQKLGNPHFTAPGPDRHFLAVIGYDNTTGEFMTNDNGTRQGKGYKYKESILMNAIRDYPTGNHSPIVEDRKVMIVVSKG